jgi:hypothetical protein
MKLALLALAGAVLLAPASEARAGGGPIIALVTSETTDQLVAVDLPSGRIVKRLRMPADRRTSPSAAGRRPSSASGPEP